MTRVSAIVVAGGRGERLGAGRPKQFLAVGGRSLLQRSVDAFVGSGVVDEVIVVLPAEFASRPGDVLVADEAHVRVTAGGARRQDSVAAGFELVAETAEVVLVHDAARPFTTRTLIERVVAAAREHGAAIAALPARDTVKRGVDWHGTQRIVETIPREAVHLAQTPQGFRRAVLEAAIALGRAGTEATDEAALAEAAGAPVVLVPGEGHNIKVTTADDLVVAAAIASQRDGNGEAATTAPASDARAVREKAEAMVRVGIGYDSHRFGAERPLVLGGVTVPFDRGLVGHSDADAISHAITDAILGAANLGDIGKLFPDTDPRWKGADSLAMLRAARDRVRTAGWRVGNVDVVVVCERPKIGPHAEAMRAALAPVLDVAPEAISIKGKTNEGMDGTGRGEGIVVHAVATLVSA